MPTKEPTVSPEQFIESLPPGRRELVQHLHDLIRKTLPKQAPCMVGKMLGYGPFHYRYASGREGDTALVTVASQKNHVAMYVCAAAANGTYVAESYRAQLPKADIGKSCVRIKRIEDVDLGVVGKLLKDAEKVGGMGAV